ncbi:MAG: class I SAM-dependent methyltransferase [Acidimicrobiales bacterium]
MGLHVAPAHYYSSTPDRRWLRANEAGWRKPASMVGIDWDLDEQAQWLRSVVGTHPDETPIADVLARAASVGGFRYGPIEAQMLHAWIRTKAPGRIFEIGSGSSTQISSHAVAMNVAEGRPATQITAVDPYMNAHVADLPHVTVRKVGGLDLTSADLDIGAGDLLFIDSTHVVKTGSEVLHLYLELLPRLAAGVTVHIHDIYLPYLFSPTIYDSQFDWQETTLVAALLVGNEHLAVRAALSALHHDRPDILGELFPEYRPASLDRAVGLIDLAHQFPSSLWLETVA